VRSNFVHFPKVDNFWRSGETAPPPRMFVTPNWTKSKRQYFPSTTTGRSEKVRKKKKKKTTIAVNSGTEGLPTFQTQHANCGRILSIWIDFHVLFISVAFHALEYLVPFTNINSSVRTRCLPLLRCGSEKVSHPSDRGIDFCESHQLFKSMKSNTNQQNRRRKTLTQGEMIRVISIRQLVEQTRRWFRKSGTE
jgi:hypothetical protein